MAVGQQVLDRHSAAKLVVDRDRVAVDAVRPAVDEHDRQAGVHVVGEVVLAFGGGHEQQAVDPSADQALDERVLTLRLLVQAGGEDRVTPLARGVLDRAQQAGGEAVAHILEQRTHDSAAALAATQVAGGQVVAVAELLGRALDALGDLGGDSAFTVHHS